ncbi:alkaline phosphatase family protein [Vibrio sp. Isolate33]|uniref:alkaline phosphatase family protein n=1 Tax=Vibrio sp. Isolate33 TaxID=2908539 RepID=UPI001EFE1A1A|nr:alkaline phosphatase family protein [Vibrio sp. Isolate33]MCG9545349.1 alkaline phosphatase family protein [Vibrio sp. Isolate33]
MKNFVVSTLALSMLFSSGTVIANETQPKLILQLTVDALRGDLPNRFKHNFGEGGFRLLLDEGVHYTNAHYQHANTETIVGHAALATGAPPAVNGMIGNVWYDRTQERVVYNIEDTNYNLLAIDADIDQSTEIDSTQRAAQGDGRSPLNIHTSTIGDEIVKAYHGKSRAFSVSFKDRGAVSLGGELGKAFWFSKSAGAFVTSDYYYDKNPAWVDEWNAKDFTQQYSGKRWELTLPQEKYLFSDDGDVEYKIDLANFSRSFPHPYGPANYPYFTTLLSLSPAGDEIVADFAKSVIDSESLGQGEYPDYLSVSFSATDYVIHMYGPSSIEAEDNLIRLDRTLEDLFAHVDKMVGLDNTLIVLSADHGAPDVPGYVNALGGNKADYFGIEKMKQSGVFEVVKKRFGLGEDVVRQYADPYLYLNHELIESKGYKVSEVQTVIARALENIDGINQTITATDIMKGQLSDTRINRLVANNHHPTRSGDIYVVYNPNVYINNFDGLKVASVHGSPWRYDTFVPIFFAGMDIKGAKVHREVTPYDIAPTISQFMEINFPSGSTGSVLTEVVP